LFQKCTKAFPECKVFCGNKKGRFFSCASPQFYHTSPEQGIDVIYIKDILGHFNIKTTERYLHERNEQLVRIISRFDDLSKIGGIEIEKMCLRHYNTEKRNEKL